MPAVIYTNASEFFKYTASDSNQNSIKLRSKIKENS
jgi:hypothetical protein